MPIEYVHPRVYALRAECPLWTNQPNPEHQHRFECDGSSPITRMTGRSTATDGNVTVEAVKWRDGTLSLRTVEPESSPAVLRGLAPKDQ